MMNIQLESAEITGSKNKSRIDAYKSFGTQTTYTSEKTRENTRSFGINLDIAGSVMDNNAYANQGKTVEDVMSEIGAKNVDAMQDYMTVMSNTLSEEDYKKLSEDGFKVGEMSVEETVTVVDEIKARLAEAGIVIEGYNDDIDPAVLEEITHNPAYAKAIANSFDKYQIEPTAKNITDTVKELEKMSEIQEFSEGAEKYLLQNNLPLTMDNLYKAAFCGGDGNVQGKGYFAEDSFGYFGKKAETVDTSALMGQFEQIINQAGLSADEATINEAAWIVESGMALTEENLIRLHSLHTLSFPLANEEITDACARAVADGKRPEKAELTETETLLQKAVEIQKKVDAITEEAVADTIAKGDKLNIQVLARASVIGAYDTNSVHTELTGSQQTSLITAKRQLEEIRLSMTVSVNYRLLKQGIQIDTLSLEKTVEALKAQEEASAKVLFEESSSPADSYKLWRESDLKIAQIRMMPAAVVGEVVDTRQGSIFTLNDIHEKGSVLNSRYAMANESYETLMTTPRSDLGDSIKKAFANVDEILNDLSKELTPENQRAVRILGYNQMEITSEGIDAVKKADEMLQNVLKELTPAKTLQMIREGVNPLETNMDELYNYLKKKEDASVDDMQKYSKFLYQLEKNQEISDSERDAYVGIYRMLRQIEKTDGAAVGTVVHNGQEMSFSNLLSAVRTKKAGRIDKTASDETGLRSDIVKNGRTISDQINDYFDAFSTQELEESYLKEQMADYREALQVSSEVLENLMESGQSITPDVLMAQNELTANRGALFKQIYKEDKEKAFEKKSAELLSHFTDVDSAREAYDEVLNVATEVLVDAMEQSESSYLDIKSMVLSCKQLSLAASFSQDENYEVPIFMDGEMTALNIRITHNSTRKGMVEAAFESQIYGKVTAQLSLQSDSTVRGYVASDTKEGVSALQKINSDLCQNILKESGKNADVTYIQKNQVTKTVIQKNEGVSDISTKELYQIAKGFLMTFAEEV